MAAESAQKDKDNPWPKRLQAWKKFSEKFHERGCHIEARYEDDREAEASGRPSMLGDTGIKKVNLFYSNTTVIKESLYNSLPKPDVSRLHKGEVENEPARVAAAIMERGLTYEIHCAKYFDTAVKSAILDRLVPGLGVLWVTFVPPEGVQATPTPSASQLPVPQGPQAGPVPPPDPALAGTPAPPMPGGPPPEMQGVQGPPMPPPVPMPPPKKAGLSPKPKGKPEEITVDIVYWKDFLYEPQKAWEQVNWAGRVLHVEKTEAKKRWGEKALAAGSDKDRSVGLSVAQNAVEEGKVRVIQMWDKKNKKVLHLNAEGDILDTHDDPYQLTNFWPFPKPLCASPPTSKFLPIPDYYIAQDQYMEMDILYARINLIIEAVKVAGVYDSSVPGISRMLDGTENKLIPVDNWAMFAEKGGVKGSIDWFPIETITAVLQQLVTTYEFMKTQLFEVTGMADIIRGSSNQYETAAAQQIKAKFASVRMNAYQRDVAFFVRDTLRIMGEMMAQLYSDEKLSKICGIMPEADQPVIPQALELLRSDFLTKYSIDIEADSLTQSDWALEQEQRVAFMDTLSTYFQSAIPGIKETPEVGPLIAQAIKFAIVGFKGSAELEGTIDQALKVLNEKAQQAAQQPPQPSPEEIKAQTAKQESEAKMAAAAQDAQLKQQSQAAELDFMQKRFTAELEFKTQLYAMEIQHKEKMAQIETAAKQQRAAQEAEQNQGRFVQERMQDAAEAEARLARQAETPPVQPKAPEA